MERASVINIEQAAIRRMARNRDIRQLFHVTRVENIPGILEHGLLSRQDLLASGLPFLVNDLDRLDNRQNHVFLSISMPNWRLLRAWQQRYPGAEWAVLMVNVRILWTMSCLYCPTNSANRRMRDVAASSLRGVGALARLFDDRTRGPRPESRPENCPTDLQAEVLSPSGVALEHIDAVYFARPSAMERWGKAVPVTLRRASPRYFGAAA